MEAIKSKSTQFIERFSKFEYANTRLYGVCISLAIACCLQTMAFVYLLSKPKPIYVIPGAWSTGMALPTPNLASVVSTFVTSWLLDWNNFNPSTSKAVYTRAKKYMSPYLLSKTQIQFNKDLEEIEKSILSSIFTIEKDPIVKIIPKGFNVAISGQKILFMGKELVKEENLIFNINVRVVGPTDNNPFGLLIESIDQEKNG